MNYQIYADGGSRGNPGPAAVGVVIKKDGQTVKRYAHCLGKTTNNEAEYQAVIFALKKVKFLFGKESAKQMIIDFFLDSELVVKQLNHQYKIKDENLQSLFISAWNLLLDFKKVSFSHIPREENKEADRLLNEALNGQAGVSSLPGV